MELLTKASYSNIANARERKNLKIEYDAACESIVLLENDGVLPFECKKVALYGAGDSKTIKGGTGSGELNERHSTTILKGMEQAGFDITTKAWIKDFENDYLKNIKYYCLVMSEKYIRNHFEDIKQHANVIENRLDDEWCTMESVLKDNAEVLSLAQKHNVNYILIEDEYEISIA